ncbi:MAG TPA: N-acylglucosamine 2-epimerase [Planctomycetaceae bacterium]|nr:N-acylglucosamine 2-epimerase [Planctomycetaceae bacterium]
MDTRRIMDLSHLYRETLLEDVLPFWARHSVDHEYGGFMTCLDRDGTVIDTDKGVWQQGRATWLFGELYNAVERRTEWLELARQGIEFIDRYCFDPSDGRMWFHVTRDGRPIRKRRYAFSESFAAIAYGELAQATGRGEYAEKAERCFRRFVDHNLNPQGVEPKFTDTRPMKAIGFPMITIVTAQQLRDSIGLEEADEWIDRSIHEIRRHFVKEELEVVMETVGPAGEIYDHFEGRTLNPGHAIEAAWFVMREGQRRGDCEWIQLGCRMLDWMWRRGWDAQYGGILYFTDLEGLPVQEYWHDMKFWWPHCEAIIATLLAWRLTGDPKYADWHAQVHDWSFRHFPDRQYGEWFGYLHRDGSLSVRLKGNLWKGPFHLPRMLLVCWQILEASQ